MKLVGALLTASYVQSAMVAVNETEAESQFNLGDDEIYQGFQAKLLAAEARVDQALTRTGRQSAIDDLNDLRRFKALKTTVLWLSHDPRFGKYCYYGCYCLAALHDSEGDLKPKQKGTPVDGVDQACKVQQECYQCMQMDEDVKYSCTANARYRYTLLKDDADPDNVEKRDMQCTDKWGSETGGNKKSHCKRAVCECDRGLAVRLRDAESEWNEDNHKIWGHGGAGFDDSVCVNDGLGGAGGPQRDTCCGHYENDGLRYPYSSGRSGCCGRRTYSLDLQACCDEATSEIAAFGGC